MGKLKVHAYKHKKFGLDVIERHDYTQKRAKIEVYVQQSVDKVLEYLFDYKKVSGKILSVGTAYGYDLKLFKDAGFNVIGVDLYPAEKVWNDISIRMISFYNLSKYFKREFDVVFINHTHEHADNAFALSYEVSKIIKKGGIVFDAVPYCIDPWGYELKHSTTHYSCFTPEFMENMWKRFGFKKKWLGLVELKPLRKGKHREVWYIGEFNGKKYQGFKPFIK